MTNKTGTERRNMALSPRTHALAAILCAALIFAVLPVGAYASGAEDFMADIEWDRDMPLFYTTDDAAEYVKQEMVAREEVIQYQFYLDDWDEDIVNIIIDRALEHDMADPVGGDYLYGTISSVSTYYSYDYGTQRMSVFQATDYTTTAAQEAEITEVLDEVMDSLELDGKTDYEKIRAVYDYICANVTYDQDSYETGSYEDGDLSTTAYGALVNGEAVCAGYSKLVYRMMLEAGINCRVIHGEDHDWNIVELDGNWYNIDATWDSTYYDFYGSSDYYVYFLKSDDTFSEEHIRTEEYETDEFREAYPVSETDYDPSSPENNEPIAIDDITENPADGAAGDVSGNDGAYEEEDSDAGEGGILDSLFRILFQLA